MSIKVVIIDDEPLAISITKSYLNTHSEFTIVEECQNGFEGLKAIQQHQPELVFLDIQMPKINGFEMLELLDKPPAIIFTTAYDQYALKAFEANALDYLMKPFNKERFDVAIKKFLDSNVDGVAQNQNVISEIDYPSETGNRLVVKSGNDIKIIPHDEILYIEAYDDYIKINIKGDCFLKKQTMSKTESQLASSEFLRVHRSYIINLREITRIELSGKESYNAILRDGTTVPCSKGGYGKLKEVLGI